MKILVTGGAGFIGMNLIKRLVSQGHHVVSLDDYSTGTQNNQIDGVKYLDADIETIGRYNGKAVLVYELAEQFGFTDANGRLPQGPMSGKEFTQQVRQQMSQPVLQYDLNANLVDASEWNNEQMSSFFKGTNLID